MKRIYTIALTLIWIAVLSFNSYGTKITISVSNFQFAPSNVSATVGDTIKWMWSNGTHTTTCDGSALTSRPAGAASWDSPITMANPAFEYVLTVAGTYNYKCSPHAASQNMVGILNVAAASGIPTLNGSVNYMEVNPPAFKSNAVIKFNLNTNAKINLSIYDFAGRKIETLLDRQVLSGEHVAVWDAASIPQGVYFCRLETAEFAITKKFVRVK